MSAVLAPDTVLTNGPAEVLHQHLRLLDLRGVNFTPHHGAEGDLTAQFLSNSQRQSRLQKTRGVHSAYVLENMIVQKHMLSKTYESGITENLVCLVSTSFGMFHTVNAE